MADNFSFDEGTDRTGAADEVDGVLYQIIKIADGNADSTTVIRAGGGAEANALRVTLANDSTGLISVDDNNGSLTIDNAALTELALAIDTEVQVDVVGSLPAGSNAIGKLAANSGVDIGDVDVTSISAGTNNIGSMMPYAQPSSYISGVTTDITDTTATSVIAAQGAGVKIYVTSIMVTNGDADTGTVVKITDGSGGTTKWRGYAAAAGGGFAINLNIPLVFSANTAVYAQCETTGATVQVSCAGFKV